MRILLLLAACLGLSGCVVTGSFEVPTKYGTVSLKSDGKTANFAIRRYAK